MAQADGTLKFDTALDSTKFKSGLSKISSLATKAVAGVAAGLGALGAAAVKVGADFEAGMSEVEAISGATGSELDALAAKAKEMGATTKFSATESAEALKYMAMAGWDTQSMLDGLPGIMNLAAASGENLATVSDIVTDDLTAFGLSAKDAGHFADVLAKASSSSNTNVSLMGATFKYAAPLAGTLGYSIEDVAIATGLMANASIKGEQAGTSLRAMFTRLASPPKDAAEALNALGISMTDANGQVKPLRTSLKELRAAFSGLSQQEQAQMASSIAGQEAMSGFLAIINASDEDFDKLASSIDNATGAAEHQAEVMNDNLKGQIKIMQSALEGLGIEFYESVQNPLKDVVKNCTGYIDDLANAFRTGGIDGLVTEMGNVFADVAVQVAVAAPMMVDAAISVIQSFLAGLAANTPQIATAAVGVITSLVTGILSLLPQVLQAGIDILLNFVQGLAQTIPDLIPTAIDCILTLVDTLIDNLDAIVDAGITLLISLADGFANAFPHIIAKIPELIGKLIVALVRNLPKIVAGGLQIVMSLISGFVRAVPSFLLEIPKLISSIIQNFKETNWAELGKNIINGIISGIGQLAGSLWEAAKNVARQALDAAKSFLGIRSPSAVFRDQIGKMIPPGMAEGVERAMPAASRDMQHSMDNFVSQAQAAVLSMQFRASSRMAALGNYEAAAAEPYNPQINATFGGTVVVPVEIDGREVARVTAPFMGEQLAFEEG